MHQFFLSGIQSKKSKDQKPHLPLSFFLSLFIFAADLFNFYFEFPQFLWTSTPMQKCKHLLPKRKTYQNTQEEQEQDGMNPKPKPVPCIRKLDFVFQWHANQISVLILTSRYRILQDSGDFATSLPNHTYPLSLSLVTLSKLSETLKSLSLSNTLKTVRRDSEQLTTLSYSLSLSFLSLSLSRRKLSFSLHDLRILRLPFEVQSTTQQDL